MTSAGATLALEERDGRVRFGVRVQPRSSRDVADGLFGTMLKIRLTAPPVDGEANEALIVFLACALKVKTRDIRIVAGHTARTKTVEIDGVDADRVRRLARP